MKQDMFVILDQGSDENAALARRVRAMGCYSEIHPHDITREELAALPGVRGVILSHGKNTLPDGSAPVPHADALTLYPTLDAPCSDEALRTFLFDTCHASPTWTTENFIDDAVEQLRRQIKGYLDEAAKAQAEASELKREVFRLQQRLENRNNGQNRQNSNGGNGR